MSLPFDYDLDQFSEFGSPRSQKSTKSASKPSLKRLLTDNFTDYITRIEKVYPDFKYNHYSKYFEKLKRSNNTTMMNNTLNQSKLYNSQNLEIDLLDYKPSEKLYKLNLPKQFITSENFIIDKLILEKKKEELESVVRDYIEKGGIIELEVQRILENSPKIYNFIEENLVLEPKVEFFLNRVKINKQQMSVVKKHFMVNSVKSILKGWKKENLKKTLNILRKLDGLNKIIDQVHLINEKKSNIQLENEKINQGKEIMKELKSLNNIDIDNLSIGILLEKELLDYNTKSAEKTIDELMRNFTLVFKELTKFNENRADNNVNYVIIFLKIVNRLSYLALIYLN